MVYARAKATVIRLVKRYGQACTWRQLEELPGGTEAKPAGQTTHDFPCTIVFLNHKRESLATAISMLVGTDIPSGGLLGLMSPDVTFTPALADQVFRSKFPLVNGELLGIADTNGIEILMPNDEGPLLYKLRLVR